MAWLSHGEFNIYYQSRPPREGVPAGAVPVILHHGMAQSSDDWFDAGWDDAFPGRPVYGLDALGHGQSDKPLDRAAYSVEKRADVVLRLADQCGMDRFVFLGFSMGGRVGFELALRHPDRVDRLVVGGMHGLKPSIDSKNLERRVAVLRSAKWRMVERAVGAHRRNSHHNDPEVLALSTEAVLDWQGAEDRLGSMKPPVLLWCGAQDSLFEYAGRTANLIPGCRFEELPGTGHAASFYTSETARTVVADFLRTTAS